VTLSFLGHPNQNPSAGGSASANLIDIRKNVTTTFEAQRITAFLPESEIQESCQGRPPFDVLSQFPRWIQQKHTSGESTIVTLMEYYYKWLYCEFGSGYILDDRIASIHDVDDTTDNFIPQLANTYAPHLDLNSDITTPTREFIKNIRKTFYSSKGTKESIYHFFNTLYKDFVYVEISYPNDTFTGSTEIETGETGMGFRTNFSRLTDNDHRLNEGTSFTVDLGLAESGSGFYEYSVKAYFADAAGVLSEKEQRDIEDLFRKLVHPLGMKLNFTIDYTNLQNID
tara:strand:- start:67 stop:918 length:852 start_codon:yes stop_codon:yes gene_type:complete